MLVTAGGASALALATAVTARTAARAERSKGFRERRAVPIALFITEWITSPPGAGNPRNAGGELQSRLKRVCCNSQAKSACFAGSQGGEGVCIFLRDKWARAASANSGWHAKCVIIAP